MNINSINEIYRNYLGSNIILIGDFNLLNILWSRDPKDNSIITPLYVKQTQLNRLLLMLYPYSCLHFSRFNFNNCNKLFDLVFCNSVYLNVMDIDSILPLKPFNPAFIIFFLTDKPTTLNLKESYLDFNKGNYNEIP